MHYRLSNTAARGSIEREMGLSFKYPNLYRPRPVISGLEETIVPVVTMAEPQHITYAIWGILPEQYNEDWKLFQNVFNTLTLRQDRLETDIWYTQSLWHRRCLVLVSGYYTFRLHNGEMNPYYVSAQSGSVLSLGGVYNQLEDGFLTFALLITNADTIVSRVQNIDSGMPLVIGPSIRETWLKPWPDRNKVRNLVSHPEKVELRANPVNREQYKHAKKKQNSPELLNYPDFPQQT